MKDNHFQRAGGFCEITDRLPLDTDSALGDMEIGCEPNPFGLLESFDFDIKRAHAYFRRLYIKFIFCGYCFCRTVSFSNNPFIRHEIRLLADEEN